MKQLEMISRYWRVRVEATCEEQVFDTLHDAREFAARVRHTFSDPTMMITAIRVTEKSMAI